MHHAAEMRSIERIRNLHPVLENLLQRQRPFFQPLRQRLSFDALHHQITDAVLTAHIVQHANVRMVQAGNGFRFALKSLLAHRIGGKLSWQNLHRHIALQPRIPRSVHFTHPARTERVQDLVGSQPNTTGECHLAAILHRTTFVTPTQIRDWLSDQIHPRNAMQIPATRR